MEGHFWIERGQNRCGISDCASFPLVPVHDYNEEKNENDNDKNKKFTFNGKLRGYDDLKF